MASTPCRASVVEAWSQISSRDQLSHSFSPPGSTRSNMRSDRTLPRRAWRSRWPTLPDPPIKATTLFEEIVPRTDAGSASDGILSHLQDQQYGHLTDRQSEMFGCPHEDDAYLCSSGTGSKLQSTAGHQNQHRSDLRTFGNPSP